MGEAVAKLVLAGSKPCFPTELKRQQDVNVISMSKWGRPEAGSNELVRTLTTRPKKGVGSEIAELHSLRRCSGDGAVLDILQEIYDQPYSECFTLHHQWFFLPYEDSGSLSAEDATCSRRCGKGCTWRVSVELSFRTSNEIQPLIEAHVLNELRKDYALSAGLALEWIANHQGMDLASGGDGCLGFLTKLLPCPSKTEEVDENELPRRNSMEPRKQAKT